MNMSRKFTTALLLIASLGLALSACSKRGQEQAKPLLENEVLAKLPAATAGFLAFDFQSEAYKRFRASRHPGRNLVTQLRNIGSKANMKALAAMAEAMEKSGLLVTSPGQEEAFNVGLAFISADPNRPRVEAGVYFTGALQVDLSKKVEILRSVLSSQGLHLQPETFGQVQGFSLVTEAVPLSPGGGDSPPLLPAVYVGAQSKYLAVASRPDMVSYLLSGRSENGIQALRQSAAFKKASQALDAPAGQFAFGYLDLQSLAGKAAEFLPPGAELEALNEFPFEVLVVSRSMGDDQSLVDKLALTLTPKSDDQRRWFSSLPASGDTSALGGLPAGTVLALSVQGGLLRHLRDGALLEAPAEKQEPLKKSLALLDSMTSVAVGLRAGSGASPFPELMVIADSREAAEVMSGLQNQIQAALTQSAMPVSPWQQKEMAGVQTQFIVSPFGIGAYLAAGGHRVVLASSEKAMQDLIAALKDKSKGLLAGALSPHARSLAGNSGAQAVFYGDFESLADALGSLQGSLAMFTGGRGFLDPEQAQALKDMGSITAAASYDKLTLRLQINHARPKNAGK